MPPDLVNEHPTELARLLPHGLMAHDDTASREDLLDVAQAQREAKAEPDGVADDLGGKAIAGIAGANVLAIPSGYPPCFEAASRPAAKLMMPVALSEFLTVLETNAADPKTADFP
jgi:hypothetical protein